MKTVHCMLFCAKVSWWNFKLWFFFQRIWKTEMQHKHGRTYEVKICVVFLTDTFKGCISKVLRGAKLNMFQAYNKCDLKGKPQRGIHVCVCDKNSLMLIWLIIFNLTSSMQRKHHTNLVLVQNIFIPTALFMQAGTTISLKVMVFLALNSQLLFMFLPA